MYRQPLDCNSPFDFNLAIECDSAMRITPLRCAVARPGSRSARARCSVPSSEGGRRPAQGLHRDLTDAVADPMRGARRETGAHRLAVHQRDGDVVGAADAITMVLDCRERRRPCRSRSSVNHLQPVVRCRARRRNGVADAEIALRIKLRRRIRALLAMQTITSHVDRT